MSDVIIELGMNFTGACRCGRESLFQVWSYSIGDYEELCPKCLKKKEAKGRRN